MDAKESNGLFAAEKNSPCYVVITPVRNEAAYIEKTLQSMAHQTILPAVWVIVNDGSNDGTENILERWAQSHHWIRVVNRENRGERQRGKGVIEAFYDGYAALTEPFDFIVKLDGDVSFQEDYFEGLLREFAADENLGIAGGVLYERPDNKSWVLYSNVDEVRGATKMYRLACFEAIGGLSSSMGWDGIDEWSALSMGWKVQSFMEYKLYHYRFTGVATGLLKSFLEQGRASYFIGYHPLYMLARGIRRFDERPYVIGGLGMVVAYFLAWLRRNKQFSNKSVVKYVRQTQLKKLVGLMRGKPVHTHHKEF